MTGDSTERRATITAAEIWLRSQCPDNTPGEHHAAAVQLANIVLGLRVSIAVGIGSSQGLCETTLTERFRCDDCACGTYAGNLGPCKTFGAGAHGRCVFCDHEPVCHLNLLRAQRAAVDG